LIGAAGWPAIFAVNLALVVPALVLGRTALPKASGRRPAEPFDLTGAVLLSATLAGGAALLARGTALPAWLGPVVAGLAAVFVWREVRHPDPVVQPRYLGRRPLAAANAAVALSNLAMYAVLLATPVLLSARTGWTSADIGLALTALSAGLFVCSPIGGRLADRLGRRWPTFAGLGLATLGLLPLALAGARISTLGLLFSLALAGAGLGLSAPGLQTAAVEAVAPREAGVAAGLFSTSRYLGSIVAAAALARLAGGAGDATGFAAVCLLALGAALLSTLASLALPDRPA
jgi:predicted MFS family arabinose efflux permease